MVGMLPLRSCFAISVSLSMTPLIFFLYCFNLSRCNFNSSCKGIDSADGSGKGEGGIACPFAKPHHFCLFSRRTRSRACDKLLPDYTSPGSVRMNDMMPSLTRIDKATNGVQISPLTDRGQSPSRPPFSCSPCCPSQPIKELPSPGLSPLLPGLPLPRSQTQADVGGPSQLVDISRPSNPWNRPASGSHWIQGLPWLGGCGAPSSLPHCLRPLGEYLPPATRFPHAFRVSTRRRRFPTNHFL